MYRRSDPFHKYTETADVRQPASLLPESGSGVHQHFSFYRGPGRNQGIVNQQRVTDRGP
jgi:hypothetical protein